MIFQLSCQFYHHFFSLSIIGFLLFADILKKTIFNDKQGRAGSFRTFHPNYLSSILYLISYFTYSLHSTYRYINCILSVPGLFPISWTFDYYIELFNFENGFRIISNTHFSLISTAVIVILATMAGYSNEKILWQVCI